MTARALRTRRASEAAPASKPPAGATAEAILEAALRVFARDGFDGASLQEIARTSAIGHPLIHYHFGSKEKLWRAAVDHALGELSRNMIVLEQASAGLDPLDALKLLCRGFAHFTARHPAHALIILNEVRTGGPRFDWLVEEHLRPLHARLDRAIEAAVRSGRIRPVPPAHLASIAVGATVHFFGAAPLVSRLYGLDVYDAEAIEAHTSWVLDILMHGLALDPGAGPAPRTGA
jgi:TetR/AcrR family transcriptional regulator